MQGVVLERSAGFLAGLRARVLRVVDSKAVQGVAGWVAAAALVGLVVCAVAYGAFFERLFPAYRDYSRETAGVVASIDASGRVVGTDGKALSVSDQIVGGVGRGEAVAWRGRRIYRVNGWAVDKGDPTRAVSVLVFENGRLLARVPMRARSENLAYLFGAKGKTVFAAAVLGEATEGPVTVRLFGVNEAGAVNELPYSPGYGLRDLPAEGR